MKKEPLLKTSWRSRFGSSCIWIDIVILMFCGFGYDYGGEVAAVVDVDVILQKT